MSYHPCNSMACILWPYVTVGRVCSLQLSWAPARLSGHAKNTRPFLRIVSVANNLEDIFFPNNGQVCLLLAIKWVQLNVV